MNKNSKSGCASHRVKTLHRMQLTTMARLMQKNVIQEDLPIRPDRETHGHSPCQCSLSKFLILFTKKKNKHGKSSGCGHLIEVIKSFDSSTHLHENPYCINYRTLCLIIAYGSGQMYYTIWFGLLNTQSSRSGYGFLHSHCWKTRKESGFRVNCTFRLVGSNVKK